MTSDRDFARGDRPAPMRRTRRTRYPNLSPTRPPSVKADAHLWPAWTDERWTTIDPQLPLFERCQRGGGGS